MYSICILPKVILENWLVFKVFKHPLVILRVRGFYHHEFGQTSKQMGASSAPSSPSCWLQLGPQLRYLRFASERIAGLVDVVRKKTWGEIVSLATQKNRISGQPTEWKTSSPREKKTYEVG